jgi:chromosome segregation ATPase
VDFIKKNAELEARVAYLTAEKEIVTKERNRLDIDNNKLRREKQHLQSQLETQEAEIEVFKRTNEDHLDRFDAKFEDLSSEFTKIKTENIELKEKERVY